MKNINSYSPRFAFTGGMTVLATLFGTAYAVYELSWQPDVVADILKISPLLAFTSMCASYAFWTLTHLKKDSVIRGVFAGLMTGLAIVPAPYLMSGFKTEFLRLHASENAGIFLSALGAIPTALKTGLGTFQVISKVSLIAVLSSVIFGVIIAVLVPSSRDEK